MLKWLRSRQKDKGITSTNKAAAQAHELEADSHDIRMLATPLDLTGQPTVMKLKTAVCYLPHPDKLSYGGEDAHFISEYGGGAIGVADGVGGWQDSGINPAEYSRSFMQTAQAYLEGTLTEFTDEELEVRIACSKDDVLIDPRGALRAAHLRTKIPGSATACVMQLDQKNESLIAANLGDSGFAVIAGGSIIVRSKAMQHYFDCPLQFGDPVFVEATDTADQADEYHVQLRPGDVIVAGTDGLWDNTFESDIVELACSLKDPQHAADALAALSRAHASDPDYYSPYIKEALSQGILDEHITIALCSLDLPWWEKLLGFSFRKGKFRLRQLTGGKQDDITVIVALVVTEPAPAKALMDDADDTQQQQQQQQESVLPPACDVGE